MTKDEITFTIKVKHGGLRSPKARGNEGLQRLYNAVSELELDGEQVSFSFPSDVPKNNILSIQSSIGSGFRRGAPAGTRVHTRLKEYPGGAHTLYVWWKSSAE